MLNKLFNQNRVGRPEQITENLEGYSARASFQEKEAIKKAFSEDGMTEAEGVGRYTVLLAMEALENRKTKISAPESVSFDATVLTARIEQIIEEKVAQSVGVMLDGFADQMGQSIGELMGQIAEGEERRGRLVASVYEMAKRLEADLGVYRRESEHYAKVLDTAQTLN